MTVRPAATVVAAVLALSVVAPPATSAGRTFRGHWRLNDVHSKTAVDSSGHHHDGTDFHVRQDGDGYTFNGRSSRVIVPNAPSLNPKRADFSFRVRLSMTVPPAAGETYDVLRKGLATTRHGDYKLEIENVKGAAVAHCVVRSLRKDGTRVAAAIEGTTDLADGESHVVTCIKTSRSLTLKVDSQAARTKVVQGGLGSVSNKHNLGLGAKAEKTAATGFDWFKGVIENAWVASP
jgi:Laminin G domain